MAEIDVKKQSHEQQRSGELQRRGEFPSPFGMRTGDFLHTSPFALMRRMTEEMDRWFESRTRGNEMSIWSPAMEVTERDGNLEVVADLPGISENDVKVEVTDEGLVIRGERKREHEEKGDRYYRSERSYGQFYRLIPLPENANVDQARAEFRNGELRVSVPVPERQKNTRQIPISTTSERKEPQSQTVQQSRRAVS